jgi:hypothetical protein
VGPDLHDPQYSEVSQDLFWIEWQFPVQSVTGAAQRSDGSTQQSTEVAADQNPFPLLAPSSRISREKDLQMLNLGRAPSGKRRSRTPSTRSGEERSSNCRGETCYRVLRRPGTREREKTNIGPCFLTGFIRYPTLARAHCFFPSFMNPHQVYRCKSSRIKGR